MYVRPWEAHYSEVQLMKCKLRMNMKTVNSWYKNTAYLNTHIRTGMYTHIYIRNTFNIHILVSLLLTLMYIQYSTYIRKLLHSRKLG